ncbi:hypothetical protein Cgig2_025885 [Carnegiea gigantea]|uniref:Insulin-degrading enzyme-like 1, peroxisomal n=1 Tax=Carnegiea gigantea TaxID=171969 RepID=A0A9Q1QCB7_9CARY|nr:hypothetical protein Cgig2_025885 [Carnegiea gigantea]
MLAGWATSLSAGETELSTEYSFFAVTIDLTDSGHAIQLFLVLKDICWFIYLIYLMKLAAISEIAFHYQDKIPPIDYVVDISSNMHLYPPRDWLVKSSLPSIYNPNIIQMILDELSPDRVRIFWESKKFEGHTDSKEPWYGTAYSLEKISGGVIQQWMSAAPNEHLHLPTANVFIPIDLSVKELNNQVAYPILLRTSSYSRLWYKPDTMFFIPKSYVKIDFNCPYAGNSPEEAVLTEIFARLLMDYLNEYAYYAQVAGLYYAISRTNCGFEVTVFGYNDKLRILLDTIVGKIVKFEVKPDRFAVIKETVIKEYQNYKCQQPCQQAMYYCSLILQDHLWAWTEQLEVLPSLEPNALSKFVSLMLSKSFLECYIAGNFEHREAESMIACIENALFKGDQPISRPLFPSEHLTNRVVKLGKGKSYCYAAKGLNPIDENSALVRYIQVHQDDALANVKLQLIALIGKQPAFYQLRSVEQLGYITVLTNRSDFGIHGVQFIIQSTAKGPKHIDQRVEAFLRKFESELHQLTEDEFKKSVHALIDMKLEKHKNLREESRFYWKEIADGTFKFDRKEAEVAALQKLTKQQLINFFDEFVKVGAAKRKTLSIRVYGCSHLLEYEADKTSTDQSPYIYVDDIFGFRRSQPLYGSFKGAGGHTKL